jgi:hypothetical protein
MAIERDALRDWHRLFGLVLTDFFTDSPFVVEIERDLSFQQQLLDVVIVRRGSGEFTEQLPDGLEGLRTHNLITFKSHREALDAWAMLELIGHYVAYRKLVSESTSDLLPESDFGLYAVAARFPQALARQVPWREVQAGVYDCEWGTVTVRVVVVGQLAKRVRNAPLHLFSASPEVFGFGGQTYRRHSDRTSGLIESLFDRFQGEGVAMPFTWEDFDLMYFNQFFPKLTAKERADVIQALPPKEREKTIKWLPPELRLAGIPSEELLAGIPPEQRLAGLTAEQIQSYLDGLPAKKTKPSRKPKRPK